jgi:hypothetical protein
MTNAPNERYVATAVLVAHRDSLRNKIVLPVERISKPRSQKLFDFSIAQDAKNDLRTSRSTGVVIRMRRCSRTGGRRLIRWKKSKSGGKSKGGERRMSYGRPLKLLGWDLAPSPRWSAWSARPRAPLPVSNPRPLRQRKKQRPPVGVGQRLAAHLLVGVSKKPGWTTLSPAETSTATSPTFGITSRRSIPPLSISTPGFRSGGWTTLEGLPPTSTPQTVDAQRVPFSSSTPLLQALFPSQIHQSPRNWGSDPSPLPTGPFRYNRDPRLNQQGSLL